MGSRACGLSSCIVQARLLHSMWDLSSLTRDGTHMPCIARWILNHWITREVLRPLVSPVQLFFLCVLTWRRKEERKFSGASSYKGINPIMRAPPSQPHLNLITPKAPPPNTITLEIRASTYGFGVATNIQSKANWKD